MMIGTVRVEEARVFDSDQGYHRFLNEEGEEYGSFEVFWADGGVMEDGPGEGTEIERPGWYWWACSPGCLPDGEPTGPFASSSRAKHDARGE